MPAPVAKRFAEVGRRKNAKRELSAREKRVLSEFREAAGNTKLLKLDLPVPNGNRIYAKCEFENPTGSHYDRVYPHLLEIMLREGFTPDRYNLVETSSGNATLAFVRLCKELGYEPWAVLPRPEELSKTRVDMTRNEGAEIVHPDPQVDGYGLVGVAARMFRLIKESLRSWEKPLWSPNHSVVAETIEAIFPLAREIAREVENIDYYVGIPGNGTTLYGIGAPLKGAWPHMKIIAVEPRSNPGFFLLKYPHKKEEYAKKGLLPRLEPTSGEVHDFRITMPGAGCYGLAEKFPHIRASVPLVDEVRQIEDLDGEWDKPVAGYKSASELLFEAHGIRVGITSAAALMVALEMAEKVGDKNFLLVFYDLKEGRY